MTPSALRVSSPPHPTCFKVWEWEKFHFNMLGCGSWNKCVRSTPKFFATNFVFFQQIKKLWSDFKAKSVPYLYFFILIIFCGISNNTYTKWLKIFILFSFTYQKNLYKYHLDHDDLTVISYNKSLLYFSILNIFFWLKFIRAKRVEIFVIYFTPSVE